MLVPFTESLWTATTPVWFSGLLFPHVMTAVRLRGGDVLLHSPCAPSVKLFDEVDRIGHVAHVVAPNWFHDLYLVEYKARYEQAVFWGPRRLRRQKLVDEELDGSEQSPWFAELPYETLPGLLTFDESIFFHTATNTLIVADLFSNLTAERLPALTRFAFRITGVDRRVAVLPYLRWFGVTVRASLRKAAQQIRAWAPDRLIVGHGSPIASDAMTALAPALATFDDVSGE